MDALCRWRFIYSSRQGISPRMGRKDKACVDAEGRCVQVKGLRRGRHRPSNQMLAGVLLVHFTLSSLLQKNEPWFLYLTAHKIYMQKGEVEANNMQILVQPGKETKRSCHLS